MLLGGENMSKKMYTVAEIADQFGVTTMGVRYWIKKGLPTELEKVIGIKPRIVIDPIEVKNFLGITDENFKIRG